MKDYSVTFNGLVTLNDGDGIIDNCTFNGELTIAAGATVLVMGSFQKEMNFKQAGKD